MRSLGLLFFLRFSVYSKGGFYKSAIKIEKVPQNTKKVQKNIVSLGRNQSEMLGR